MHSVIRWSVAVCQLVISGQVPGHLLDLTPHREYGIVRTRNRYGLAAVGQNVHFDVVAVQIGGEFHASGAIP